MGPAFDGPPVAVRTNHSDKSFVAGREKPPSPVDVAPPVAAFTRPVKAFPPPRIMSTFSDSSESTRALLAARYKHTYTASIMSTSESVGRSITPVSDLNQIIATPEPAFSKEKSLFHLPIDGSAALPAPRRNMRSTVVRQLSMPSVGSPSFENDMTAVSLKTPAGTAFHDDEAGSQRDSFINMYASRSPIATPRASVVGTATKSRMVPPTLVLNDGEPAGVLSARSVYSSTSSESSVPSSAFVDKEQLPVSRHPSILTQLRERTDMSDIPESGISPLAWASLVTDAATSNGGSPPSQNADLKASRRRSRSMDNLAIPSNLRPRAIPKSATLRREFAPRREAIASSGAFQPASAGLPPRPQNRIVRVDSKATLRSGPSRTPSYRTSTTSEDW